MSPWPAGRPRRRRCGTSGTTLRVSGTLAGARSAARAAPTSAGPTGAMASMRTACRAGCACAGSSGRSIERRPIRGLGAPPPLRRRGALVQAPALHDAERRTRGRPPHARDAAVAGSRVQPGPLPLPDGGRGGGRAGGRGHEHPVGGAPYVRVRRARRPDREGDARLPLPGHGPRVRLPRPPTLAACACATPPRPSGCSGSSTPTGRCWRFAARLITAIPKRAYAGAQ